MNQKKMRIVAGMALIAVVLLAACKSAPPAAPEAEPAVEPAVQPAVEPSVEPGKPVDEALTSLRDECEALREKGMKYGVNTYKPEGWGEAESSRNAGLDAYGKDYDASEAAFKDAIEKYNALINASFDEISVQLEAELLEARAKAIELGADSYFPEQFSLADEALDSASSALNAGSKEESYASAQIALMRYRTLILGMEAVALNDDIIRNDFTASSSEDYAKAGEKYEEAAASYGTADPAAFEAASECVAYLKKVSNAGYKAWALDKQNKVGEIKSLCDAIKAKRSMPNEYAAADMLASDAEKFGTAENDWKASFNAYSDAEVAFTNVYQEVSLRRNAADLAISAAKNRQTESSELARQADETAPLPDDAEGFSEDPYVIDDSASGEVAQ